MDSSTEKDIGSWVMVHGSWLWACAG